MSVRTLIVENDEGASLVLEAQLLYYDFINVIDSVSTIKEALKVTLDEKPDLIFLDIELDDGKAFDFLKQLSHCTEEIPEIVFMTAWGDYAVEAYRYLPFAFLEKPFNKPLLNKVIEKFKSNWKKSDDNTQLIKDWIQEKVAIDLGKKLKFPTKDGVILIDPKDVIYLSADRTCTDLFFSKNRVITISLNLGKIEELLKDQGFHRIGRSVVINGEYLLAVNKKKLECTLYKDGETIPLAISKDRVVAFIQSLE